MTHNPINQNQMSDKCFTESTGGNPATEESSKHHGNLGISSSTDYAGAGSSGGMMPVSGGVSVTSESGGLGSQASQLKAEVMEKAIELGEQAKHKLSEYTEVAKDKAREMLDEGKNQAADLIGSYAGQASQKIEGFSSMIRQKDMTYFVNQIEDFARRQPVLFIGGALALGLLAGRFLKSSHSASSYMGPDYNYSSQSSSGYQPVGASGFQPGGLGREEF